MPLVYSLQLNLRTKVSLAIVLSLGWSSCAAGIAKIYKQTTFNFEGDDQDFHDTFFTWYFAEFTVGIVAASLPPLKRLFAPILEFVTSEARVTVFSSRPTYGNREDYQNTTERWDNSFALDDIGNGNSDEVRLYSGADKYLVDVSASQTVLEVIRSDAEDITHSPVP